MKGLLDHIFSELDIGNLSKEEVKKYLEYLNEILPQLSSNEQKFKFLSSKINLNKRLVDLDYEEVKIFQDRNFRKVLIKK